MKYEVGQLVVCIKGDWNASWDKIEKPQHKGVYTIRRVVVETLSNSDNPALADEIVGLLLEEIKNPERQWDRGLPPIREMSFPAMFFRPVRKTDLSILTEHLKATRATKLVRETEYEKARLQKSRKENA